MDGIWSSWFMVYIKIFPASRWNFAPFPLSSINFFCSEKKTQKVPTVPTSVSQLDSLILFPSKTAVDLFLAWKEAADTNLKNQKCWNALDSNQLPYCSPTTSSNYSSTRLQHQYNTLLWYTWLMSRYLLCLFTVYSKYYLSLSLIKTTSNLPCTRLRTPLLILNSDVRLTRMPIIQLDHRLFTFVL